MRDRKQHWWCDTCKDHVPPEHVTFEECHDKCYGGCGDRVTQDEWESPSTQSGMKGLTWKCHICGKERPDNLIGVYTTDISKEKNLSLGCVTQNVRYCKDKKSCCEKVKTHKF